MAEESQQECQLRRRRSSGPNLPLQLDVGFQVTDGGPSHGTPSPCTVKFIPDSKDPTSSSALLNFRKKQQSFEIHIEECEEEEIMIDSDEETEQEVTADRPITPTPIQDFGANVKYTEGPQTLDFLKVKTIENECLTDVSDAESDEEE